MSLDKLFPSSSISPTENDLLIEVYSNPVVKKHLQVMAMEEMKDLAGLFALSKSDSEIAKAHATINGKLAVLHTLLSINPRT